MPAASKQQQKFMGIVRSIQKGEQPAGKFSKAAQDAAKKMKKSSVKKYAKTKHDDLPIKKESKTSNMMKAIRKGGFSKQFTGTLSTTLEIISSRLTTYFSKLFQFINNCLRVRELSEP